VAATRSSAASQSVGTVAGTVTIRKDGKAVSDLSNVVVYLADTSDPEGTTLERRVIRQKDERYVPYLTVVPKGTTISFPNDDKYEHNVFSPPDPDWFDLGRYKKGPGKARLFNIAGEIDLYCDIHPSMEAKVKVVPSSLFARVGSDGKFRIDNVPAGTHTIVAWLPNSREVKTQVKVEAGKTATASALNLQEGDPLPRHRRKDGTDYAGQRYDEP
jgi:plastocyanin